VPALTRRLSGRIAYRAADGGDVGHELFDLSSHPGGHVLRALCVLDDVGLVRDVSLSMDGEWRPLEGHCRLVRDGHEEAALWFGVEPGSVRVEGRIGGLELPRQVVPTKAPLAYLGLHPLQGDALIVQARGTGRPGEFVGIEAVTNSVSPNGDEAVGASRLSIEVAYMGAEDIAVAAGRFVARRYQLRWRYDWPPADLWVRATDCLFLAMRWSHVPTRYELASFAEELFR
jgi:hypothetical protein